MLSAVAPLTRAHVVPSSETPVAYFSMEIAVDPAIPTYSGGLGVLAGDTLLAAADLSFPMVGVTLLFRQGYFQQELDAEGRQSELVVTWSPETQLDPVDATTTVRLADRAVRIRAWRYCLHGVSGGEVQVLFLDTDLPENDPEDRALTGALYGGDARYRLSQETVLAVGGLGILRALGYKEISTFHMNEGHAALLPVALLQEVPAGTDREEAQAWVRNQCVFTTHTPVEPGHDRFHIDLVRSVLGEDTPIFQDALPYLRHDVLNMTTVALNFSRYTNAVSQRHEGVSRKMFPGHAIDGITNGVHAIRWASPAVAELYDRYLPEWRRDHFALRQACTIPLPEIQEAHAHAKAALLAETERLTGTELDPAAFTIGFARRVAGYKRGDFLLSNPARLQRLYEQVGPIQVIYAGKAHPRDADGKAIIERIYRARGVLGDRLRIVYLANYDVTLGKLLCSGVDLWLNNPQKPLEASGTSGMKAALNGIPSLSTLDGWWIEGHVEGVTGWAIGESVEPESEEDELASLYDKLEFTILPLFYEQPLAFAQVMRSAMALNGSYFNTQRMLLEYIWNAYRSGMTPEEHER